MQKSRAKDVALICVLILQLRWVDGQGCWIHSQLCAGLRPMRMQGDLHGLSNGFCNNMLCPSVDVFHCIVTPTLSQAALPSSTVDPCHSLHCPSAEWSLWSCRYWLLRFSSCTYVCLHSCQVFWFCGFFSEKMLAAYFDCPGGPENLYVKEVMKPHPGEGEVLVKVSASALNRADLLQVHVC